MNLQRNSINKSLENFREGESMWKIDDIWAADLIDMQTFSEDNNGIKYLLTVIDIFSELVWIVPLKRKTEQEVAMHFQRS